MTRIVFLAVLMVVTSPLVLTSPAHAGRSISFNIGGHRVHIARHCRSIACTSMSISKNLDWRRKPGRNDDPRDTAAPLKPVPPVPQAVSPPVPVAPPVTTAPAKTIVTASPPAVYAQAASRSEIVATPAPLPVHQDSIPAPPPPSPTETTQPESKVERVSQHAGDEPSEAPIGDWQTEGKGTVRIAKCGNALCGYMLNAANENGEAILINMKPKTERQWSGGVYSQNSGETYYGTMSIKGINTLRVEACALGRFYCSGNNWSRIARHADSLATSWQVIDASSSRLQKRPVTRPPGIQIRSSMEV